MNSQKGERIIPGSGLPPLMVLLSPIFGLLLEKSDFCPGPSGISYFI